MSISKEAIEQIRVGVLGATDTNMTIDEAVNYIVNALAGYVELAEDQKLPENPYFDMADAMKGIASPEYTHAQRAREEMLKGDSTGGWRKVIGLEVKDGQENEDKTEGKGKPNT